MQIVGAGLVPALRQGTHEGCPYKSMQNLLLVVIEAPQAGKRRG
jgi:hypothetical protein